MVQPIVMTELLILSGLASVRISTCPRLVIKYNGYNMMKFKPRTAWTDSISNLIQCNDLRNPYWLNKYFNLKLFSSLTNCNLFVINTCRIVSYWTFNLSKGWTFHLPQGLYFKLSADKEILMMRVYFKA